MKRKTEIENLQVKINNIEEIRNLSEQEAIWITGGVRGESTRQATPTRQKFNVLTLKIVT